MLSLTILKIAIWPRRIGLMKHAVFNPWMFDTEAWEFSIPIGNFLCVFAFVPIDLDCPRLCERLSLACNKFYVTLLMCLWCIRMLSIYWGSQGNPGGDESFVRGQYYMTFERSGSSHINFQKSSVYEPKSIVDFPLQFPKLHN